MNVKTDLRAGSFIGRASQQAKSVFRAGRELFNQTLEIGSSVVEQAVDKVQGFLPRGS